VDVAEISEEKRLLRDGAAAWARANSPASALRRLTASGAGFDAEAFKVMAAMGWTGIVVPEDYGGAAFGYFGAGLLLEELGRTLTPSPLAVSSVGAVTALTCAGSEAQKRRWLPQIASGDAIVTLAVEESCHREGITTEAKRTKNGYILNGVKRPVLHGLCAQAAIVSARWGEETALFLVETEAHGLARTELKEIERRGAAIYHFADLKVEETALLGSPAEAARVLDLTLDAARVAIAAEMVGAAAEALEVTLAYLRTRKQFGRLIGEFQALQHRAAELYGEIALARAALEAGLGALDEGASNRAQLASLAKALAGDAFRRASAEMIQMHGGIGMTSEHDAGLYFKRARIADLTYGGAHYHRERYARLMGY
jgi:alkylation response protein AidB-like acyl-CoA dehydrogenase